MLRKSKKCHLRSCYDAEYLETLINEIDQRITQIVLKTEKKNASKQYDNKWSITLHQQSLICRYWATIRRGKKNGLRTNRQTSKLYQQMNQENQKSLDTIIGDASAFQLNQIAPKEEKRNLNIKRELVQHHEILRAKGMQQLAELRLKEGNKVAAKAINQISKAETNRQDWKVIQKTMKPHYHSGLTTIKIPHLNNKHEETENPDEAVSWKRVTDPSLIEDRLLTRNIKHFGQSQGSLFTSRQIQDKFDYEGVNKAVELLLQGAITIPETTLSTPGAKAVLEQISNKNKLPEMNCEVELPTFISTLRKWSEKTSTSPIGRHLGHYKCLLIDDKHKAKYTENDTNPKRQNNGCIP
jgi:hypothetical protein